MKVLAICRGAPGLGRVVPSLALIQALSAIVPVTARFASYQAGARYLAARGDDVTDLGAPDGLFIDSVSPQALRVVELAEQEAPELVLIDGEFFLPPALAHLDMPVVYLANPHDLTGEPNTFRRVNRLLLAHADAVNTTAEAAYCGIPAILLPVTADLHRGSEQAANAAALAHLPGIFPACDWRDAAALRQVLRRALSYARQEPRSIGRRGNDRAAAFVAGLVSGASAAHRLTTA